MSVTEENAVSSEEVSVVDNETDCQESMKADKGDTGTLDVVNDVDVADKEPKKGKCLFLELLTCLLEMNIFFIQSAI